MWIANISANHIRDAVVRRNVESYQREFAVVLHDYLTHGVVVTEHDDLPEWARHDLVLLRRQSDTIRRVGRVEVEQERQLECLETVECRMDGLEGKRGWLTALGYSKLKRLPSTLPATTALGRAASRICRDRGITPSKAEDQRFGEVGVYPAEVLDAAAAQIMGTKAI